MSTILYSSIKTQPTQFMTDDQKNVVLSFLSTIDTSLPIVAHFKNAMDDAISYKWPSSMLVEIMIGIEDVYNKK